MTPLKAIRAKCLDCSCGSSFEVKLCPITGCALYPYRFGHNPQLKGKRVNNLHGKNAHNTERFTDETISDDEFINNNTLTSESFSGIGREDAATRPEREVTA